MHNVLIITLLFLFEDYVRIGQLEIDCHIVLSVGIQTDFMIVLTTFLQ